MPKESHILPAESSNMARVSPYQLRSSRTNKNKAPESSITSEWEDVRCMICMEPPHNAILLTCSSFHSGCRPYMCDTSVRHSNCFKQFRKKKKTLNCPLCRGEVLETTKVTNTARKFMNDKPRACSFDDCEFSGTYSQLQKHLKNEHHGLIPRKIEPQRQLRWEQINAASSTPEVVYIPVTQIDIVTGTVRNFIRLINVRDRLGLTNEATTTLLTCLGSRLDSLKNLANIKNYDCVQSFNVSNIRNV